MLAERGFRPARGASAQRLIEAAVSAEFEEFLSAFEEEKSSDGRRRVVRNGHLAERQILTGIGAVEARVPKARSRSGAMEPFRSSLVPPYVPPKRASPTKVANGPRRSCRCLALRS